MNNNKVIKEFAKRDVFYNNGLVNLKIYLEDYNIEGLYCQLSNEKLILQFSQENEDEYYNKLFKEFIINNNIVFQTDNDRLYWDIDNNRFVYDRKYDIKGKSSGNDVKYSYKYITPAEIKITTEELFSKYLEFAKENNLNEGNKNEDEKIFKKDDKFKDDNKCYIPVFMTKSEFIESYMEYSVKEDMLNFDSKIHQFEDGGFCFRDMLNNKDNFIDKWDALIYWYGVKIKRFFNSSYFIYINSIDLLALYEMKEYLDINDDPVKVKDENKGTFKSIPTNMDLSYQLKYNGIKNENFYISNTAMEFQVKFFMYLASRINHVEEIYKNEDREKIRQRKEKLYNSLPKISFVVYTEDGNMKSSLEEYTKAYRIIRFFTRLINIEFLDSTMFKYLAELMTTISMSKDEKEKINLNIKKFCDNMLKFIDMRKVYYEVSYKMLKKDKGRLGAGIYDFENIYLNELGRGDYVMSLHSKSKELGEGIGLFAANLEDKDLLFKLRNVKNHKQMVAYFKDLKFTILKKKSEARFTKEFNEVMEEILLNMEESPESWEIIRDYISIYAIDKYRSTIFAKQKQLSKGGK